jgi:hypothetical protein
VHGVCYSHMNAKTGLGLMLPGKQAYMVACLSDQTNTDRVGHASKCVLLSTGLDAVCALCYKAHDKVLKAHAKSGSLSTFC